MTATQRQALVFGGSGQIGIALLHALHARGWQCLALSRHDQPSMPSVQWLRGDFANLPELPGTVDAIFSCGPLDHFAAWYAGASLAARNVVAFGSTSLETKRASSDEAERDLAQRLDDAERLVFDTARRRNVAATLLRPTLVYGAGRDRSLARIAEIAVRRGFFLLPAQATGLRQPVHVDDLAQAALAAIDAPAAAGRPYALPGGETLTYRAMVARTLQALQPPPRLFVLPDALFRVALATARIAGLKGLGDAAVARMREDLVFDATPAQRDLGYAPRPFDPVLRRD